MKRLFLTLALIAGCVFSTTAQESQPVAKGYQFTDSKILPTTPVKDQAKSGTCWCFSTLSFLESEILAAGGAPIHLSEMWIVRNIYFEKAIKYVRLHGALNFAVGGASHDVFHGIKAYGIVPQEVYPGFNYGTTKPLFNEIDAVLKAYVETIIQAPNKTLTTAWQQGLNAILDAYFGVMPEKFTWQGKEYTPQTFAASLPIKLDDYVDITSFTHHPFYTPFVMEVPDNWLWASINNVPLDELMSIVDASLAQGHTVAWATDVSEPGFNRTKAIGIIPEAHVETMAGSEAERWGKLSNAEKNAALYSFDKPGTEKTITQEMRQVAFDNYETTDDHGMVIVGTATDQAGNPYYKVLNSWDVRAPYDGFFYFSRPFVAYKTMGIIVNKKVIPADIRKKLGIK
ncbi:MAG: C1 family peptidase [Alistipes sp.]